MIIILLYVVSVPMRITVRPVAFIFIDLHNRLRKKQLRPRTKLLERTQRLWLVCSKTNNTIPCNDLDYLLPCNATPATYMVETSAFSIQARSLSQKCPMPEMFVIVIFLNLLLPLPKLDLQTLQMFLDAKI